MAQSTASRAFVFILRDIVGDLLYWPVWWYTAGAKRTAVGLVNRWLRVAYMLSFKIMLQSLFKPMYADYSRSGRAISFFMRLILIAWRGAWLLLWTLVAIALMLGWLLAPLVAGALWLRQIIPFGNG